MNYDSRVMTYDSYALQGGEGDCFYVVGSGEFEVLATQVYKLLAVVCIVYSVYLYEGDCFNIINVASC